jgi:ketosteroid isomerase-like protein
MDARDEIARRRADFVTAFNREDLASLEQLCTDDIVMLPPNQPRHRSHRSSSASRPSSFFLINSSLFRTSPIG